MINVNITLLFHLKNLRSQYNATRHKSFLLYRDVHPSEKDYWENKCSRAGSWFDALVVNVNASLQLIIRKILSGLND